MTAADNEIASLREALRHSPDHLPLRKLLAQTLMKYGHYADAEKEYRSALGRMPEDLELGLGLAEAFHKQQKTSQALVVIEDLRKKPDAPPRAAVLHARLLFQEGEVERAVRTYNDAVAQDPAVADSALAQALGIDVEDRHSEIVGGRVRASQEDPGDGGLSGELERPQSSFADVGGMEELKEEIRLKIIHPLTHPEIYEAYGKKIGGGILMYGPPGCGKTYLARATAGEVKANFLAIGIHDVLEMWIGQSERNLHEVFEHARRNKPCVLFFDEVDALGASRTDMRHSASKQVINQFLSELDGVKDSNEGVLIMAATNAPWHLDSAFRRPGRFDRIIFVPPPDDAARAAILRIHLTGKPVVNIDFDLLAKKTPEASGADLKGIVEAAVESKLSEALKTGVASPIETKDLLKTAKKHRPTTREWFATARNYALYSNQGGIYDDLLPYLKL